ncbi:MAG TPA: glycosyltransferase family 4 protein [Nocardioidaceae bacterium]|nr:glycosyltransferase family 4 protein [Nocardioidaceae bacterium]
MQLSEQTSPRIGYVLKMYPRFSETFIVNEVLALEEQGVDLEIFSLRLPVDGRFHETLAAVQAPVTYLDQPGRTLQLWDQLRNGYAEISDTMGDQLAELFAATPGDAAQAVQLAGLVRARRIDHLHAHFGSIATTVARLAARLAGITYSFTAHAKDIFHEDVDGSDLARKLADAAAAVTVSDYNLTYLRNTYGDLADGVVRIYNGLDLETFAPSVPADRPPVVVAVGRLVEKKGFDRLIDAVALLVRDGRELRLDLVGSGAGEAALRAQAAVLGIEEVVRFLGPLPQSRTRDVVRGASVLAAPCVVGSDGNRDGLPTVLLEALALGTPVVATPVTGIPEAVIDGATGMLVPEGDVPALAAALGLLLDDAELRCELAAAGRRHIEASFDVRRNTGQLHAVLAAAAASRREVAV